MLLPNYTWNNLKPWNTAAVIGILELLDNYYVNHVGAARNVILHAHSLYFCVVCQSMQKP